MNSGLGDFPFAADGLLKRNGVFDVSGLWDCWGSSVLPTVTVDLLFGGAAQSSADDSGWWDWDANQRRAAWKKKHRAQQADIEKWLAELQQRIDTPLVQPPTVPLRHGPDLTPVPVFDLQPAPVEPEPVSAPPALDLPAPVPVLPPPPAPRVPRELPPWWAARMKRLKAAGYNSKLNIDKSSE